MYIYYMGLYKIILFNNSAQAQASPKRFGFLFEYCNQKIVKKFISDLYYFINIDYLNYSIKKDRLARKFRERHTTITIRVVRVGSRNR